MLGNNPQHSLLELVPTPGNMYVYSEERNSDFRVSSSVIKNGFDPRTIQISGRFDSNPAVSRAKGARNIAELSLLPGIS